MRKSRKEAAATRARIVDAASAEFRRNGIDRTGLNDLMGAAGLTHGGFYKHFASKDQAVSEACAAAVAGTIMAISSRLDDDGFDGAVDTYLSTKHRDAAVPICPFAALGSELARSGPDTRSIATAGFSTLVDVLSAKLAGSGGNDARSEAIAALATMFGAMMMSRISAGTNLSAEILDCARSHLHRDRADPAL